MKHTASSTLLIYQVDGKERGYVSKGLGDIGHETLVCGHATKWKRYSYCMMIQDLRVFSNSRHKLLMT